MASALEGGSYAPALRKTATRSCYHNAFLRPLLLDSARRRRNNPDLTLRMPPHLRTFFLTNDRKCGIMSLKIRKCSTLDDPIHKKGDSSMPSRRETTGEYCKKRPFLGLKGRGLIASPAGNCGARTATFCARKHRKLHDSGRSKKHEESVAVSAGKIWRKWADADYEVNRRTSADTPRGRSLTAGCSVIAVDETICHNKASIAEKNQQFHLNSHSRFRERLLSGEMPCNRN